MNYAKRTHHLVSEGAYQVLAKAQELEAQGRNIIHLEIGQPDFETFPNISQAGINAGTCTEDCTGIGLQTSQKRMRGGRFANQQ